MKTIPITLAILLTTIASFAIGCAAQAGDEPAASEGEALMNNGGGPEGPTLDYLLAAGYHCIASNVPETPLACWKKGGEDIYLCNLDTRVCILAPSRAKPPSSVVARVPIDAPVRALE